MLRMFLETVKVLFKNTFVEDQLSALALYLHVLWTNGSACFRFLSILSSQFYFCP